MKVKVIKMAKTNKRYEPEFKKKMVRLVLEEGRTIASVNKEYGGFLPDSIFIRIPTIITKRTERQVIWQTKKRKTTNIKCLQ